MVGRRILFATAAVIAVVSFAPDGANAGPDMGTAAGGSVSVVPSLRCGSLSLSGVTSGQSVSTSATLGTLHATLSGSASKLSYEPPGLADPSLQVAVHSRRIVTARIAVPQAPSGSPFIPSGLGGGTTPYPWSLSASGSDEPLCIARFGGARPETAVLVALYSGGAHCCTWLDAYPVRSNGTVSSVPITRDLGNPAASLFVADGHAVIVTADNSFAYEFASFGGSGLPLMTLELQGGKFVVTTRQHLNWVAVDAAFQWGSFVQSQGQPEEGLGWLAAWAADMCTLGKAKQAFGTLQQFDSQGRLGSAPGWPSGSSYVSQLRGFLAEHRYCS